MGRSATGNAMTEAPDFKDVSAVVADPLRFKARLRIGENAYATLKLKRLAFEAWDTAGAAATGAAVAASPAVATTFFGATGFWAALGLGTAAATPVGWIVLAGAVTGGAWFGLSRALRGVGQGKVTVIPDMISTPLDVLGLQLFELMAPLALKLAAVDGAVAERERGVIRDHFVQTWGYDATFVRRAMDWTESRLGDHAIRDLASALAELKRTSPDCDAAAMGRDLLADLRAIALADGPMDEREEMALERIEKVFADAARPALWRRLTSSVARLAGRRRAP
jgi:uncharacterized tellurite resistance protein B-like protein